MAADDYCDVTEAACDRSTLFVELPRADTMALAFVNNRSVLIKHQSQLYTVT
jgi:hypothetical protein